MVHDRELSRVICKYADNFVPLSVIYAENWVLKCILNEYLNEANRLGPVQWWRLTVSEAKKLHIVGTGLSYFENVRERCCRHGICHFEFF